jgi:hypothetical protein
LDHFFNPQPKPIKKEKEPYKGIKRSPLKPKSIDKRKPKLVEKIPMQKKVKKSKPKNDLKVFQGTKIPKRADRNEFTMREKEKICKAFGGWKCALCGNPYIEFHHAKFRSASADGSGRGVWRNGVPLCNAHHSLNHTAEGSRETADKWRAFLKSLYGEFYFMDEWDLWLLGKIEEPDKKHLEEFMEKQEAEVRNERKINPRIPR